MKLPVRALFIILNLCVSLSAKATEDADLALKLKEELNFNQQRRKGFQKQSEDTQVFDREREKGLSLFLEEQEKFDIDRERGVSEYKRSKKKPLDESSPEYFADLKYKKEQQVKQDEAQKIHVQTRDQILSQYSTTNHASEYQELGLINQRPRYELRKRYKNKWVKNSSKTSTSSSGSSFGGGAPAPESPMDFPAPVDYAPQPIENFEEIPPPPPPIPFENQGFESGFGENPAQPPPPPPVPEGGWDF